MSEAPAWIQAIASVLTFFAAVAAGWYARRAAIYTKRQAEASDQQVKVAKQALQITRTQAQDAKNQGVDQLRIAGEALEVARTEAGEAKAATRRQVEEAQASHRRYEESRLDAIAPVVLAVVRRPGAFVEMRRRADWGEWPVNWSPIESTSSFEEDQKDKVMFRLRLEVTIENVSGQIARVDVLDSAGGQVNVKSGRSLIIRPSDTAAFRWTRTFTPMMLGSQEEIDNAKNWLFDTTLWVRDLGMNVKDIYKFNSDLRLFGRDGTRLVVRPEPEHTWEEDVAQPLQKREYDRLENHHAGKLDLSGEGTLSTKS